MFPPTPLRAALHVNPCCLRPAQRWAENHLFVSTFCPSAGQHSLAGERRGWGVMEGSPSRFLCRRVACQPSGSVQSLAFPEECDWNAFYFWRGGKEGGGYAQVAVFVLDFTSGLEYLPSGFSHKATKLLKKKKKKLSSNNETQMHTHKHLIFSSYFFFAYTIWKFRSNLV